MNTGTVTRRGYTTRMKRERKKKQINGLCADSPVLVLEDELPQLEVAEDQPAVVAMRHGRGDLVEEPGGFVLPQLLAGADEGVQVAVAPLEEHVGPRLPEQDLQDLVDVLVLAQGEVGRQRLLVSADVENLQPRDGEAFIFTVFV